MRIAAHLSSGALGGSRGRPRQTELRRAVSAAYYAMFHTLAACCANTLAGAGKSDETQAARQQAYRALEHGHARRQCADSMGMSVFPAGIQDFGRHFVDLQVQRQSAEYDPNARYLRLDVTELISETMRRIEVFNSAPRPAQRAFALYLLLRAR